LFAARSGPEVIMRLLDSAGYLAAALAMLVESLVNGMEFDITVRQENDGWIWRSGMVK